MTADPVRKNIEHKCRIRSVRYLNNDIYVLVLENSEIAGTAVPGQFVNVDCGLFLKRPISISGTDRDNGTFSLGIRIKGKGTQSLSGSITGDMVTVHGPLGKGFDLSETKSCVAVGGGVGIFPLMFLLDEAKKRGIPCTAVCGFKSDRDSFCTPEIRSRSDITCFSSDCGDMDFDGNAADALKQIDIPDGSTIFTCGPVPMMRSVYEYSAAKGYGCFASLEERMGCGTGICLVCSCKIRVKYGTGDFEYKRCCHDGPVFDASEVLWD